MLRSQRKALRWKAKYRTNTHTSECWVIVGHDKITSWHLKRTTTSAWNIEYSKRSTKICIKGAAFRIKKNMLPIANQPLDMVLLKYTGDSRLI